MTESEKWAGAKKRLKRAPKQYKSAPRLEGRARLQQRLMNLFVDVHTFAEKATDPVDIRWAELVEPMLKAAVRLPSSVDSLVVFQQALQRFNNE